MAENGQEHRKRTRIHGRYKGVIAWGTHKTPMTTKDVSLKGTLRRDARAPASRGALHREH